MIFTCSLSTALKNGLQKNHTLVLVDRYQPKGFVGIWLPALAPELNLYRMLNNSDIGLKAFFEEYQYVTLRKINCEKFKKDYDNCVIVSRDRDGEYSHRYVLAKYLMDNGVCCVEYEEDTPEQVEIELTNTREGRYYDFSSVYQDEDKPVDAMQAWEQTSRDTCKGRVKSLEKETREFHRQLTAQEEINQEFKAKATALRTEMISINDIVSTALYIANETEDSNDVVRRCWGALSNVFFTEKHGFFVKKMTREEYLNKWGRKLPSELKIQGAWVTDRDRERRQAKALEVLRVVYKWLKEGLFAEYVKKGGTDGKHAFNAVYWLMFMMYNNVIFQRTHYE